MRQRGGDYPSSTASRKKTTRKSVLAASCAHDDDSRDPAPPPLSLPIHSDQSPLPNLQAGHSPPPPQRDDSSNCGGKPSIMPQKHMLQRVIDILQRRDTYEIFAEPVDPNEVEDYYRIIKEPMDFGTMRAKLHEGMYDSLEQFQHDVFLITRNAMHFNSSATIYFKQARAIHELAVRVFHVLGTDPENFEVEFSGTRRRSTRRAHNEANRLTKHVKASSVAANFYSKGTLSSLDTSVVGKANRRKPLVASSTAFHTNKNSCGLFSGATVGRRSNYVETDRRSMYIPQSQSDKNIFGSNCFPAKPLVLTSHQGTNYRESLLLFVKDLGPIAHMFAAQKTRGLHESSSTCQTVGSTGWGIQATDQRQTPAACGFGLREPHHWNSVCTSASHRFSGLLHGCCCSALETTADIIIDRGSGEGGEENVGKRRKSCTEDASISDNGAETAGNTGEANVVSASGRGKVTRDGKSSTTESWLGSCSCDVSVGGIGAGNLNNSWIVSNKNKSGKAGMVTTSADTAGGGKLDESVHLPVVLALEHSHGNVTSELKSRNRKSCTAAAEDWGSQSQSKSSSNHVNITWGRCHEATGGLATSMKVLQPLDSSKKKKNTTTMEGPPASLSDQPFTFNMCFLKAQLNQMKLPEAAERNKQDGQRHDDDGELQLIKSPNWDRDDAETRHKRASASYFHVQGQKRTRLYNATATANTALLALKSTSGSRPLSSLEPRITTNSYASKPVHAVTLPTNNNDTTSSSNTNTESSFSSWPWGSGCYGHGAGSHVEQNWS
ncbi:uncharacterized protein [Coffea arabica]|uniref:Uncharacterized protein isoform X1 n=1 Tax=Coffea arabica TaxID=13443 RepID=A0A6P6SXQ9_COFAR